VCVCVCACVREPCTVDQPCCIMCLLRACNSAVYLPKGTAAEQCRNDECLEKTTSQDVIVLYNKFVLFLDKEAQCGELVHPRSRLTEVVWLRFSNFVQQFANRLILEVDSVFRMVGNSLNTFCRSSLPIRSKFFPASREEGFVILLTAQEECFWFACRLPSPIAQYPTEATIRRNRIFPSSLQSNSDRRYHVWRGLEPDKRLQHRANMEAAIPIQISVHLK
jgi:hypothetical protein